LRPILHEPLWHKGLIATVVTIRDTKRGPIWITGH